MFTSHLLALFVSLLVEKPCMKLQKAWTQSTAETTAASGVTKATGAKKERPRVFENPNAKFMNK